MKRIYIAGSEYAAVALLGLGIYLIITELAVMPSSKSRKTVSMLFRESMGFSDQFSVPLANFLVRFINIETIRKKDIQLKLNAAEIKCSPEFYIAKSISDGILIAVFAVPMLWIMPVASICCIVGGVLIYFQSMKRADRIIKQKRENIETDMVLFASTICQSISTSRDVMKIFQSFRNVCGDIFRHELDVTIADMKTGNYEEAIKKLDERVNSSDLSEIIKGLLSVMHGDDQRIYFEMLTKDLMTKEKENLKKEARKRPEKMNGVSVFMVICFLTMFMYAVISQVFNSFTSII